MQNGLFEKARFRTAGDRGLLIEYGDVIDPAVNSKVRSMAIAIEDNPLKGVIEVIPTYRSLLMIYDPVTTDPAELQNVLETLEARLGDIK
ncbi:MAG: carboxyltransferase domain-containing protein, partial [Desulfobacterales bacterium]